VAELAEHDVLLRRRNAPRLRLSEVDRDDERSETFDAPVRSLRNLVTHSPTGLEQTIADVFAWGTFLPKRDRAAFVDESTITLTAVGGVENFAPVGQMLREWKTTAKIHADPQLARRLRRPIDADGDAVPVPS